MEPKKECAPGLRTMGRSARDLGERPADALDAMASMLSNAQPLSNIRTEWASRTTLAKAWDCGRDTVSRRCRRAGVRQRVIVSDGHRAQVEFLMLDVRAMLGAGR
jgi:hypothetical protein